MSWETEMTEVYERMNIRLMRAVHRKGGTDFLWKYVKPDGTWTVRIRKNQVTDSSENNIFAITEYWPIQNKYSCVGNNTYPKEHLQIVDAPEQYRKYL